MNFRRMPDVPMQIILDHCPVLDQQSFISIYPQWTELQRSMCHTKKSLSIYLGHPGIVSGGPPCYQNMLQFFHVTGFDVFPHDHDNRSAVHSECCKKKPFSLSSFPNVTKLTIVVSCVDELKYSNIFPFITPSDLLGRISSLWPNLTHLKLLNATEWSVDNYGKACFSLLMLRSLKHLSIANVNPVIFRVSTSMIKQLEEFFYFNRYSYPVNDNQQEEHDTFQMDLVQTLYSLDVCKIKRIGLSEWNDPDGRDYTYGRLDDLLDELSNKTQLTSKMVRLCLNLKFSRDLAGFERMCSILTSLTELILECSGLEDALWLQTLSNMQQHLKSLTYLMISNCDEEYNGDRQFCITKSLATVSARLNSLTTLYLQDFNVLPKYVLSSFLTTFPNLRKLVIELTKDYLTHNTIAKMFALGFDTDFGPFHCKDIYLRSVYSQPSPVTLWREVFNQNGAKCLITYKFI